MQFIKCEKLKPGMRLARPIYSKKGVLLYDRATVLKDAQSIENIKSFGLIGLFVLEPAEPVPPMTDQEKEFERFQTMMTFEIKDELSILEQKHKPSKLHNIVAEIIRNYGNCKGKITFNQNLRDPEDYVLKHSLNVAILSALIAHKLNVSIQEQTDTVTAAVIHDIGKMQLPVELIGRGIKDPDELDAIASYENKGYDIISDAFAAKPNIKRICAQAQKVVLNYKKNIDYDSSKLQIAAKILTVAGIFDIETAVRSDEPPISEVLVIRRMMQRSDVFDQRVVQALIDSLNILIPGVSVELNTGEKGLVLRMNERNFLRPMILSFSDNSIIDLDSRTYNDLEVIDIMKTMDNRCIIDTDQIKSLGF